MQPKPPVYAVLVAEDDGAIRRLLKTVLEREGFDVETATDGVEAILKLGLREFDVIILDLMMPQLDGFELLATLAANDPGRLRSIIVTSATSPATIAARITVRPFALLPKPFDIDAVGGLVRRCAEQRGADESNG